MYAVASVKHSVAGESDSEDRDAIDPSPFDPVRVRR
jgi:hypothetical protein